MADTYDKSHLVAGLHSRGVLPHLKREGGTDFVTFRQAGTLPAEVLFRFKQERQSILDHALAAKRPLTWHEQEELFRWYLDRVDHYLEANHGECHLRRPACGCSSWCAEVLRRKAMRASPMGRNAEPRSRCRLANAAARAEELAGRCDLVVEIKVIDPKADKLSVRMPSTRSAGSLRPAGFFILPE
jgi:hypothetical protein